MLSETKVVKARKAIESLYQGTCTVTEHQKVVKANKSTGFSDVVVLKDQPCRLSFKTVTDTDQEDNAASAVKQVIVLFIAPDVSIATGSKITVTQNGVTTDYQQSGKPALYDTHQEIILDLFREWS